MRIEDRIFCSLLLRIQQRRPGSPTAKNEADFKIGTPGRVPINRGALDVCYAPTAAGSEQGLTSLVGHQRMLRCLAATIQ